MNKQERKILDSGERCEFLTGAHRDVDHGKPRPSLVPPSALLAESAHMAAGAAKYDERNWEKGIPLSRYFDSAIRHLLKWQRGDRDEPHLTAARWNLTCLYQTDLWIRDGTLPESLNDMPGNNLRIPPEYEDCIYVHVPD